MEDPMEGETHLALESSPIEISRAYRYSGERLPTMRRVDERRAGVNTHMSSLTSRDP